ncbi:MAG TPA: hypothetical protein VMT51_00750 [Dongiaceae bacterium]|nr:hypothetical protein [Dongiaceae bacterium]
MHRKTPATARKLFAIATLAAAACIPSRAQEPQQDSPGDGRPPVISVDRVPAPSNRDGSAAPAPATHPADGHQRGNLPAEAYAVVPGTRLLVRLEDSLDTGETKQGKRFKVKTLEPLFAGSGIFLPSGAEITGHVSRVDPAGVAGRAKIWLVFDEIHTRFGVLPLVADVVSVPGDHSVRSGPEKEGLIEGRSSTQQAAAEAAAEGAGKGALHGIKDKNAKEAAEGAAVAALAAYLMEAGRGHELNLPKGTKLELELERALYLLKE